MACELRFGVRKRKPATLEKRVEGFLSRTPVLPFLHPADHAYTLIRLDLEAAGTPISANGLFIAAQPLRWMPRW